jgi:SHS2 domain-containing protein
MSGERERRGFRDIAHTADKAIEAWGATLAELFTAAAEGMISESEDCSRIPRDREWEIEVEGESAEDLMHAWLSELLWVAERDEAMPCEIEVDAVEQGPWRLRGRARGGRPPRESPHTGAPVKAVTYHGLRVWQEDGLWRCRVVFDV